ncbi:AmmeMemoRadiSam system protein B [bacterium]|nr:AmmeMemoRadiSam system protein B [bacterium]
MNHPRLRFVEAYGVENQGEPAVIIRDPEGLCQETLAVPLPMFLVMLMFDGRTSVEDVQQQLMRKAGGVLLPREQIDSILAEMDKFYLLENERAAARRLELEREYEALPARPASHAGSAYPDDPAECEKYFDHVFDGLDGKDGIGPHPRGLIIPHIDWRIGGRTIAGGLSQLDPGRPADLYIILGVAHQPARNVFVSTSKSFETPLGLVKTDETAAARLAELYGAARLSGASVHRFEHSVEFAAVGLKYLHRNGPAFSILPILCSGLPEELIPDGRPPIERPEIGDFIKALRRLINEYEGRVCIIASVDLSHVGRKFGDEQGIDDLRMQSVRRQDGEMLERVTAMDPEGFFSDIRRDGNARHVDATTAVYVMLHVLGSGKPGDIDYQQWHEEETDSMVTFASMPIY